MNLEKNSNNKNPIISIITVSYNSNNAIAQNIASVDRQDFKEWEHIIIDNKSNDFSIDIIKDKLNKKRKLISENDEGIYDAMNKGLKLAKGSIIIILNADDRLASYQTLSNVFRIFKTTNCEIIYSGIEYIDLSGKSYGKWLPEKFKKGSFINGFNTPHPGFFVKRNMYEALGNFDKRLKIAADFDLMKRFLDNDNYKSVHYPIVTVKMQINGASSKVKNIIIGFFNIIASFKKTHKNFNPFLYFSIRYGIKIIRKLRISYKIKLR